MNTAGRGHPPREAKHRKPEGTSRNAREPIQNETCQVTVESSAGSGGTAPAKLPRTCLNYFICWERKGTPYGRTGDIWLQPESLTEYSIS